MTTALFRGHPVPVLRVDGEYLVVYDGEHFIIAIGPGDVLYERFVACDWRYYEYSKVSDRVIPLLAKGLHFRRVHPVIAWNYLVDKGFED